MPKILPRHINNATGQLSWTEAYNSLTTEQLSEFWKTVSGTTNVSTISGAASPGYGEDIITFDGNNITVELDIRIPVDLTLGASGFLRVAVDAGNAASFSAGLRAYGSDDVFLGARPFLLNSVLIGTTDTTSNQTIFDVGANSDQFPSNTSFVKPYMSWTTLSSLLYLKTFVVRPLENARKALYV